MFAGEDHRTKVNSHHVIESFGSYFFNGCILACNADADIIVQDVDSPPFLYDRFDEVLDSAVITDIQLVGKCLKTFGDNQFDRFFCGRQKPICDGYLGSFAGE